MTVEVEKREALRIWALEHAIARGGKDALSSPGRVAQVIAAAKALIAEVEGAASDQDVAASEALADLLTRARTLDVMASDRGPER